MRRMGWAAVMVVGGLLATVAGLAGCGGDPLKPGTRVVITSAKAGEKYALNRDREATFILAWNGTEAIVLRQGDRPEDRECKLVSGDYSGHTGIFDAKDLTPIR